MEKYQFQIALTLILFVGLAQCAPFPKNFTWGVATAAYQIEGAWNISGKGLNIWDVFTQTPNLVYNNQTGQVADDFYHLYLGDIKIMQQLGIKNFRMSLSWARLLPNGTINNVNQAGVDFYNQLFDALSAAGIEPWVTLYHWDLPQAFNDMSAQGTWLNPNIPNLFNDYADFCFKTFGSKVKYWLTFNEISVFSWLGYGTGVHAPGRCTPGSNWWCEKVGGGGNTSTEPYAVAKNVLVSHALAVKTYRTKYQSSQGGLIGLTLNSDFAEPYDPSNPDDVVAVDTYVAFQFGWFGDPIVFGKYPDIMTQYVTGGRLTPFNQTESEMLKGSFDFIGLNHYTSKYVHHTGIEGSNWGDDNRLTSGPTDINGTLIGPYADSTWLNVYPPGMRKLLNWIDKRYNHPPIYIFENGVSCPNESSIPLNQAINDTFRINYLKNYIANMVAAVVEDGVDVRGYFCWSLIDNFEWADGYNVRFGLTYIDYANNLTRYPKASAYFYAALIKTLTTVDIENDDQLSLLAILNDDTDDIYDLIFN